VANGKTGGIVEKKVPVKENGKNVMETPNGSDCRRRETMMTSPTGRGQPRATSDDLTPDTERKEGTRGKSFGGPAATWGLRTETKRERKSKKEQPTGRLPTYCKKRKGTTRCTISLCNERGRERPLGKEGERKSTRKTWDVTDNQGISPSTGIQ